ncbi:DUF748 domain-containing protein [Arcobacter sp. s6]|uniref:DUF748 domain-containing protein n=1 Tax=Arcobacter sp. s6 TaxID=3230363 RepID=UPI00349FFF5B
MGKLEKSFYWLCFTLAIYITIGFKIIPTILEDQLVKNLDENLTQKTTIEKIEFNPFTFNLKIHNFKLSDSNQTPTISFKEFTIDFGVLKSIENLNVSFQNISLVDALVNVIEEKDGQLNLTKLVKPSKETEEEKEEDDNSKMLNFLVSKLSLENANINYINQEENPYSLSLKNINYTLYDLGTFNDILSSNDLKLKLNENTNITIGGAFKLEPFRGYGKISIEDLRLKELLAYKKDLLNFDLDENANLNLLLNYDFHANKDFALNINSDKFEFNNINLKQNETDILNLLKLDIKTFVFNLDRENIRVEDINFDALKVNMISSKDGLNFANLIKEEKKVSEEQVAKAEEKNLSENKIVQEELKVEIKETKTESSKPWTISLKNIKINNSDFTFDDKTNDSIAQTKAFNVNLDNLKIVDSDIDLTSLKFTNPNLSYNDNKNKLSINSKNANINLDKLTLKKNILDINKIEISKDNLVLDDKKANFSLLTKKTDIALNSFKIDNGKTSINSITLKTPSLNFDDNKSKMSVKTPNIDININSLLVNDSKTSISTISLKTPSIEYDDTKSKINVKTSSINLDVNTLAIEGVKTSIKSISLKTPTLDFDDKQSKMSVKTAKIDLDVNTLAIEGSKTSVNSINLKTPTIDFDDEKSKMNIKTSNINLDLNSFSINDSNISLKEIKLLKPTVKFVDNTNNLKIDANNIELYVNNLSKINDKIAIDLVKLIEPDLDFLDTSSNTKIEAKKIDLQIKKLSNSNSGFKIEKTDLNNPNIAITLPKTNASKPVTKVVENKKVESNSKDDSAQTKLDIGPININNALFSFEDKNLPVPFKTVVTKLNGKISEFKNTKSSTTTLNVNGVVDKYGVAKITGIVHPTNIKVLTDINMIFNNIAISNFTPYSGKFVGREINSGKLDMDLKYNIEKSNLDAKNNITISKLELGKSVQSPDAVSLPLDVAVTLLKNSQGIIDIKLPVSGNVDDPTFSIGSIVWNAFVNLMTKAVTAPFSLLGAIFNFSPDEINSVDFDLAHDEITPIQKETLDKISQILTAKQDLAIKISASYDKQKEEYALKEKKYLEDNPKDATLKKEDLEKEVIKEKAELKELEEIAKNRILNIKNYLIKEKKIDSKQIILTDKIETSSSSINIGIEKI